MCFRKLEVAVMVVDMEDGQSLHLALKFPTVFSGVSK